MPPRRARGQPLHPIYPLAREACAAASATDPAPQTRTRRGGNDDCNARQVAKREHFSVAELLAEFEHNRAGPLALVFYRVAVDHVLGHVRDILGHAIALDLD